MIQKMLSKHGNSLAVVIEKPILELLGIQADTPLNLSTDGRSLILTPIMPEEEGTRTLDEALQFVNKHYGRALKRLAE